MHEEAPDRPPEGPADRLVHKLAPCARTDRLRHQSEIGKLSLAARPKIEFEEAEIGSVPGQRESLNLGMRKDRSQNRVRHHRPAEPEPILADAAKKRPVAGEIAVDPLEPAPGGGGQPLQARTLPHLQIGDDRRDLAGRKEGHAVEVETERTS